MRGKAFREFQATAAIALLFGWLLSTHLEAQSTKTGNSDYVAAPLKLGSQNQLIVHTTVNGKSAGFVVDTGAPLSCMSEQRASYFGLKPFGGNKRVPSTVVANGRQHRVAQISAWRLGSVEVRDTPVILIDMSEVERHTDPGTGQSIDGIIGLDVLCALGALIDYSGGDLYLRTSLEKNPQLKAAFDSAMSRGGWTGVPMRMSKGHFVVESAVNGNRASFIVDTGAPVSVVDREFSRRINLSMTEKTLSARGLNFSDQSSGVSADSRLTIGQVRAGKWPLVVFDLSRLLRSAKYSNPSEHGLLGSHTLLANGAVIDCESMRLYLRGVK